ncbi:hypothetical protein J1N35_007819 [Gossypium stocksii]|uniref:Uncharacterized protein n=1 Tax=Gossypium stocksii TaxID=47602 RepID=A0A9D3W771_9ROSI|nr:hypothetical protein J1N35_007819 [Gossypium stocksii]
MGRILNNPFLSRSFETVSVDYFLLQMEVYENMSQKERAMMASNNHPEGSLGGAPTGNGLMAPTPRFKQCKVSIVRDFLPGCDRVAASITRPSEQAKID